MRFDAINSSMRVHCNGVARTQELCAGAGRNGALWARPKCDHGESGSGKSVRAGLQSRGNVVQLAEVICMCAMQVQMVPHCTPVHA